MNSVAQFVFCPGFLSCPSRPNWRNQQGCVFFWRLSGWIHFQYHSSCWQNLVSHSGSTRVPVFLLAVTWRLFLACRSHLALGPLLPSSKLAVASQILMLWISLTSLSSSSSLCYFRFFTIWLTFLPFLSTFKGSCNYIRPNRIIFLI